MQPTKKIIVYCHGYGSSPKSDKVTRLSKIKDSEVFSFPINVDPSVSLPMLELEIDSLLLDRMHEPARLIFVGTSLGGWYASVLAKTYGADAWVINPSRTPGVTLMNKGVPVEIASQYFDMPLLKNARYVVAEDDELLDHSMLKRLVPAAQLTVVKTGGHRFNGPEFDEYVAKPIEQLIC